MAGLSRYGKISDSIDGYLGESVLLLSGALVGLLISLDHDGYCQDWEERIEEDLKSAVDETTNSLRTRLAAKEFETELKKEPDASAEPPVGMAIEGSQEEKQDAKVSSTKESS
ncbi:hypothetical protein HAX54_005682 [Datura stramonium]|uniref:Uncharacterized protein n=1 Tax=Datura stramonium TaxID=4076 RepID=A0ABS8TAK6_DATST|nr:hypothetical protein [Datura stramonium]